MLQRRQGPLPPRRRKDDALLDGGRRIFFRAGRDLLANFGLRLRVKNHLKSLQIPTNFAQKRHCGFKNTWLKGKTTWPRMWFKPKFASIKSNEPLVLVSTSAVDFQWPFPSLPPRAQNRWTSRNSVSLSTTSAFKGNPILYGNFDSKKDARKTHLESLHKNQKKLETLCHHFSTLFGNF